MQPINKLYPSSSSPYYVNFLKHGNDLMPSNLSNLISNKNLLFCLHG